MKKNCRKNVVQNERTLGKIDKGLLRTNGETGYSSPEYGGSQWKKVNNESKGGHKTSEKQTNLVIRLLHVPTKT